MATIKATQTKGQRVTFYDTEAATWRSGEILSATDSTQTVVYGNDGEGYRTADVHHTKLIPLWKGPDGRELTIPGTEEL